MVGRLDGKVGLVTGAGSGIGRASALTFAREGAKVAVSDVVVEGGQETVRLIQQAGGEARFFAADVSKAAQVEKLIQDIVTAYGRLDCAHNNAGVEGALAATKEYPEEQWDKVLAVNLKGVWLCMKYQIPQMLAQGGGAIVNTASVAGCKRSQESLWRSARLGEPGEIRGLAGEVALQSCDQHLVGRLVVEPTRLAQGEGAFHPPVARITRGTLTAFAPQHGEADHPFGKIVGRLHALVAQKDIQTLQLLMKMAGQFARFIRPLLIASDEVAEPRIERAPLAVGRGHLRHMD